MGGALLGRVQIRSVMISGALLASARFLLFATELSKFPSCWPASHC